MSSKLTRLLLKPLLLALAILLDLTSSWVESALSPDAAELSAMIAMPEFLLVGSRSPVAAPAARNPVPSGDLADGIELGEGLILHRDHLGVGIEDPLAFHHV